MLKARRNLITLAGFTGLVSSSALAQPCPTGCPENVICDPNNNIIAAVYPYPLPNPDQFVPDRRPGMFFGYFCGKDCRDMKTNPFGFGPAFQDCVADGPDDTDAILTQLQEYYDDGFRRMVWNRPGGGLGQKVHQSQFYTLKMWRRNFYTCGLRNWIDNREAETNGDFSFGVFIGSWQNEPCTPDPTFPPTHIDVTDATSMQWSLQNFWPWIYDVRVNEIWLDNSGTLDARWDLYALQYSPDYDGIVKFAGEAIPRITLKDGTESIDWSVADKAAWMILSDHARAIHLCDFPAVPTDTELIVVLQNPSTYTIAEAAAYRDKGYVLWAGNRGAIPYIQQLYDGVNNDLYNALDASGNKGDFDLDGDIDTDDQSYLISKIQSPPATNTPSVYDGDYNNDQVVDIHDFIDFRRDFIDSQNKYP